MRFLPAPRGLTFIETIVAVGVLMVAFAGLYNLFQASVRYLENARAREGATSLAIERMEQMRALTYDEVGTVSGIPSGTIAQEESVVLDGLSYDRRTFVAYVDDPADGSGAADTDGITTDYKVAKVAVSWLTQNGTSTVDLISNFIPVGLESNAGGGTMSIAAIDSLGSPLAGATVHIVNSSAGVDVTTQTNASGIVAFPGTPAAGGYQITVSRSGYSTAQTYSATGQNANPSPGNLTVVAGQTTSASFAIDRLASLFVDTWSPISAATTTDTFADATHLSSQTGTQVSGGALELATNGLAGTAQSTTTSPAHLVSWSALSWNSTLPAGTTVVLHIYDQNGNLIPDAALPGNGAGFTTSPVSLSGLSTTTYSGLTIGATLTSGSTSVTPQILDWSLGYTQGPAPLPNISFTLQGSKIIGTTSGGASIYKFSQLLSSGSSAQYSNPSLEWDSYTESVASTTGYDVSSSCPLQPLSVSAGASVVSNLYLVPHTQNSLSINVRDLSSGSAISSATTTLTGVGTQGTDSCGNAFFSGLSATSYSLSVQAAGHVSTTTTVAVSGQKSVTISL